MFQIEDVEMTKDMKKAWGEFFDDNVEEVKEAKVHKTMSMNELLKAMRRKKVEPTDETKMNETVEPLNRK